MPRTNPDAPVTNPNPTPGGSGVNPDPFSYTQPDGYTPGNDPQYRRAAASDYTPPPPPISRDNPAYLRIKALLDAYGLGSLVDWAYDQMVNGRDEVQVTQDLRDRDEFKARFRGLEIRRQRGLPPMSVDEYLAYERQAASIMHAAGLPAGFYDSPDDYADLIGKDVSVNELQQRVADATTALYQSPQEVRDELSRQYGVTEGTLAAWFLDSERAMPEIQRQFRSAQIGAEARRQQFGPLTAAEAERLAELGIDAEQAAQAFGALAQSREITGALAVEGDPMGMSRAQQLAAVGGDAAAQAELEWRRRRRQSAFEGGGGFAQSDSGLAVGSNRAGS